MKKESTHDRDPLRPGTMSNTLIRNLVGNYRQNHMSAIKNSMGIDDAHSIWFDLPKLKRFISMIEEEAGKINPETTEEDLGIRFYYAAYPKAENWDIMATHPVDREYAEKHTLVMVPTLKKTSETGESLHYDFNPLSGNGEVMAMAQKSRGLDDSDDIGIGENSGQLIPPKDSIVELF
ncbi:hypothetical protein [Chryseobacterium gallinarum]|uniref:Uncharacterized protein n=1 Tax=Chryseobacterium gallinarum TaxID=1324352 RepID=A0ABX6KRC3_CHRGL|nr:hypothetical protein [Chryseobacterium gallinarum]QIY91169.1 hypothetical protein FOB44_11175 [Chryseobacterium gallinarum]